MKGREKNKLDRWFWVKNWP